MPLDSSNSTTDPILEALRRAHRYLARGRRYWCKGDQVRAAKSCILGAFGRDDKGQYHGGWEDRDGRAAAYLVKAMTRAEKKRAKDEMQRCFRETSFARNNLAYAAQFNNHPDTTYADVLVLLARAIQRREAETGEADSRG